MNRSNSYPYSLPTPPSSRYSSSHSNNSSARSSSANADEDWTKVSDLAERRRIQNRIAQRNYRKKLKRRLEDLEKRANSSSVSPEPIPAELESSHGRNSSATKKAKKPSPTQATRRPSRSATLPSTQSFITPEVSSDFYRRQYRNSPSPPPPTFYSSYPHSDPYSSQQTYTQSVGFGSMPSPYSDYQGQSPYLPLPVTLPSMPPYDTIPSKPGAVFTEDDIPYGLNFTSMAMGVPMTPSYSDPTAHTPPLSLSHSFDHSRTASPSEPPLMGPDTPLSMSPNLVF